MHLLWSHFAILEVLFTNQLNGNLCKTLQYRKVFANAVVGEARIPLL